MLGLLIGLAGIVSLVCWILVLLKLFPAEGVGLGILGIICSLYTFIWGWQHADENNQRQVMIAWSAAIVVYIVAYAMKGSMAPAPVSPTGVPGM